MKSLTLAGVFLVAWLLSVPVFLAFGGCTTAGPIADARHVLLTPEQVTSIAQELGIPECPPEARVAVAGAEVRNDGSVDLAITCVKP